MSSRSPRAEKKSRSPPSRSHSRSKSRSRGKERERGGGGGDRDRDRDRSRSRSYSRGRGGDKDRKRDRSYSRSRSRGRGQRRGAGDHEPAAPSKVLGIFGLNASTREEDLREEFSRFGELESCTLITDKRTGESKRFGFIYFKNQDDATKAKESLTGMTLHGNQVRIDYSITRKAHSPTPGRYMGKVKRIPRYGGRGGRYAPYNDYSDRRGGGGYDYGYDRRGGGSDRYDDRYSDRYDRYDDRSYDRYDDRYDDRRRY